MKKTLAFTSDAILITCWFNAFIQIAPRLSCKMKPIESLFAQVQNRWHNKQVKVCTNTWLNLQRKTTKTYCRWRLFLQLTMTVSKGRGFLFLPLLLPYLFLLKSYPIDCMNNSSNSLLRFTFSCIILLMNNASMI